MPAIRLHSRSALVAFVVATLSVARASTNGDNLIGVGTPSRALGGNDIAAPQDALGAISENPAALTFLAGELPSEADLSLTFFVPHVSTSVGGLSAESAPKTYLIPSLGIAGPLGEKGSPWQYGFAAYGVSGLGVDYRQSAINTTLGPTPYPLVAADYTQLQILELAPSIAYRASNEVSLGIAVDVDYGQLNLGSGKRSGFGLGVEPGVSYRPSGEPYSFGASYISGKPITYKGVVDLDGNGPDNLKLESPQQFAFGAAYELVPARLLVVADVKWVNWNGAKGYHDFDWRNTWVYGLGIQFDAIPKQLVLRAGYTYGDNPVTPHNNFAGAGAPANVTEVQGKFVNNYYYETFRIVGFPAVVQSHFSLGLSYSVGIGSTIEAGYTHAFKNTVSEQGTKLLGIPTTLSSSLSEDSYEIGFKYRF